MLLEDRRMKVREISETTGISKEGVGYILHEELDMKNLCARWVPRLLTAGLSDGSGRAGGWTNCGLTSAGVN
jgi:hypothetical protein